MEKPLAKPLKRLGLPLRSASVILGASALFVGCSRDSTTKVPLAETVALAETLPTPKPKPTPTPGPTPRPKKPGIALYKVETKRKVFALTFDDGPDPTYTPKILKILKQKNAPATFFMVGKMVKAHAPTGKLVVKAGHPIGGHSWSHPMKTHSPPSEITLTNAMLKEKLGVTPAMFRPPYGLLRNGLAREASKRGEDVILWSSDSHDWNHRTSAAQIKANVMKNLAPGGIALMHDGGGNRAKTVAALPGIIDGVRNRGYKLVTVPELLNVGPPETAVIGGAKHAKSGKQHATKVTKKAPTHKP